MAPSSVRFSKGALVTRVATSHPATVVCVLLALALVGCGSSADDTGTTLTTATGASSGAVPGASSTAAMPSSTTTSASLNSATTVSQSAGTVIEAIVAGGEVTVERDRFEVTKGSEVTIRVSADVAGPVHLHGYDVEVEAAPGKPAEITFVADIPGVFEVELEDSGKMLFEVEVK